MHKKLIIFLILINVCIICTGCTGGDSNMSYKETRNLCNEISNGNIDKSLEIIEKVNNVNKTTYPPFLSRLFSILDTSSITTPLIQTVELGNIEIIEALLKKGADPDFSDGCGSTAIEKLYNRKHQNNFEIAKLLIEYGANVNNTKDSNMYPIFSLMVHAKSYAKSLVIDNMELLLKNGALVIDKKGYSIIRLMINNTTFENDYIDCILENSTYDINTIEPDDKTNLMYLVEKELIFPIEIMLSKGIDKTIKNSSGKTALDIAKEIGNIEIISLLNN